LIGLSVADVGTTDHVRRNRPSYGSDEDLHYGLRGPSQCEIKSDQYAPMCALTNLRVLSNAGSKAGKPLWLDRMSRLAPNPRSVFVENKW